jgi:hypothetical protein
MSYAQQIKIGKRIEREHLPYYHKVKKSGKCPTDAQFTEGIAKAHISEDKNYYTKLKKARL